MRVRQVADTAIRKAVHSKDNPADLTNVALEELVRARCELPAATLGKFKLRLNPRQTCR